MQSTSPDAQDEDELTTDTLAAQLNDVKNYYEDEIEASTFYLFMKLYLIKCYILI